jgi:nicotinamide-nucleotide adenylyltransferase
MVRWISKREQRIIVGIGSAQDSHTMDDPFTAGERYEMIYESLKNENIGELFIVPIEDLNRNSLWVAHVISLSPHFDRVCTNNPLVKELFEEYGMEVISPPVFKRKVLTGRKIRELMLEDEDWKNYVPEGVARFIEHIDGVQRMKQIRRSDEIEG